MTRRVIEKNLTTRDSRKKLPTRAEPHWRLLESGLHIGYRKVPKCGTWVARRFAENRRYKEERLGLADDMQDANGKDVLSIDQAQKAARAWFEREKRAAATGEEAFDGNYTVAKAMKDYLAHYSVEGKGVSVTTNIINAHILPALGDVMLANLTTKKINEWLRKLASTAARVRTPKAAVKHSFRVQAHDEDAVRSRRATANRILTVLKAALNYAWHEGRAESDSAWRKVKPFKNVEAPKVRYLTRDECVRLINACPPDLRAISKGALFTGCRYGELVKLKVSDFNADANTVFVRESKNGESRFVVLTDEGRSFFQEAVLGKSGEVLMFAHDNGTAWGQSHQSRPLKEACSAAKIEPAIGFHILRHTYGSLLAMQGVPISVIAKQLGHANTRMTEKHYAHLAQSYVADTIRQNFPTLGLSSPSNVIPLELKAKNSA